MQVLIVNRHALSIWDRRIVTTSPMLTIMDMLAHYLSNELAYAGIAFPKSGTSEPLVFVVRDVDAPAWSWRVWFSCAHGAFIMNAIADTITTRRSS
jgi:hypothetical protein